MGNEELTVSTCTVCICTRNRVKYLGPTIDAVLKQYLSNSRFDVLVVDNGSTDGTAEMVAERFGTGTPVPVRYTREEKAGLSRARNRAVAETTSDIIAFLDDDAIPEPGWLQAICNGFSLEPGIDSVGGAVVPVYEETLLPWLPTHPRYFFPGCHPGCSIDIISPVSMAQCRLAFGFCPLALPRGFGVSRGQLMPAEETTSATRKSGGNS